VCEIEVVFWGCVESGLDKEAAEHTYLGVSGKFYIT